MRFQRLGRSIVAASAVLATAGVASAQVVERDTKITGPKGNTIDRQLTVKSGPGFVDRNLKITRPGGATFDRNTLIKTAPGPRFAGPGPRFGPPPRFGPGPRPFIGREIIVNNGGGGPGWLGAAAIGGGLFGLGALVGNAVANNNNPPPPAYYAPPANVVYNQPVPYGGGAPAPTVVVDPVAQELARLASHHPHTRRDAAGILGRMRDSRAVMPLVEKLKNDSYTEVRLAAAQALGEIGDPQAGIYLERAATYDKKKEVREAAAVAYSRLGRAAPAVASSPGVYQQAPANDLGAYPPQSSPPPPAGSYPNTPPPPPMPDPVEAPR